MSSWKKASKAGQKFHKERGQLKDREGLGFLEKKKDYKLRALDYQKKRETLVNLKRKINEKNPDEFYFNMAKTQMKDGEHRLRNETIELNEDELKLMKSQDINYIKMHLQMELKKIDKLKSSIHLIDVDGLPNNKHKYFQDEKAIDKSSKGINAASISHLNKKQLEQLQLPTWLDNEQIKEMLKARVRKYKELIKRYARAESLRKLEEAYTLKMKKLNPEEDYDEKYKTGQFGFMGKNDSAAAQKYSRVIPRKK